MAKWIKYELNLTYGSCDSKTWYKCPECQQDAHGWVDDDPWYSFPILSNYCPNCGAKMEKENDDGSNDD